MQNLIKLLRQRNIQHLLVVSIISLTFLLGLFARVHANQPLEGDQPHYVIMANSLNTQGDLNLKDDYSGKLYRQILRIESVDPHINFGLVDQASEQWYSIHSPGLAILIAPILAVSGLRGVLIFMALLGTALCVLTYYWSWQLTKKRWASLLASGTLVLSIMYLNLVGYIFVDIPIAGILLALLIGLRITQDKPNQWMYAIIGALAAINVWVHVKTGLMMGTVMLLALYQIYSSEKPSRQKAASAASLLIPFGIIFLLLCYQVHRWFGVWLPNQIYKGNNQMFQLSPITSVSAIFFDSFKGIFTPNPAFLLIFSGIPIWWRLHKNSLIWVAAVTLPSFLIQSTFDDWAGGWSPAGRYQIELIPLYVPAIAFTLIYMRGRLSRTIQVLLIGANALLAIMYIAKRIPWVYAGNGSPLFTGLGLDGVLPRFDSAANLASLDTAPLIFAYVIVVVLVWRGSVAAANIHSKLESSNR